MVLIVTAIGIVGIVFVGAVLGGLYFFLAGGTEVIAGGVSESGGASSSSSSTATSTSGGSAANSNRIGGLADADYFILLVDPNIEKDLDVGGSTASGIARLRDEHLVKLREKAAARFPSEAG